MLISLQSQHPKQQRSNQSIRDLKQIPIPPQPTHPLTARPKKYREPLTSRQRYDDILSKLREVHSEIENLQEPEIVITKPNLDPILQKIEDMKFITQCRRTAKGKKTKYPRLNEQVEIPDFEDFVKNRYQELDYSIEACLEKPDRSVQDLRVI